MSDPHEEICRLINQPDARDVLRRVRERLNAAPKGRLVNTRQWNALTVGEALEIVREVAAEFGINP